MPDQLQGIVQKMVEAGEPEEDIALVIKHYQAPAAEPEGKSLAGFGANVLSSGAKFAGDIVDSAKGLGHMASRVAQGVIDPKVRAENRDAIIAGVKNIPNAVGEIAKSAVDRYGSLDKIGNTLYNDPIGVLGDVAGVAGLASGVGEAAGATRLARAAGTVERMANPASLFARAATPAARAVAEPLQKGGVSLYNRVLKPSTAELEKLNPSRWGTSAPEKAHNVSEALINEGVNVNAGGVAKIGENIDRLGAQRRGIVETLDNYHPTNNPNGTVTRVPTAPLTAAVDSAADFTGRRLANAGPIDSVKAGHGDLAANKLISKTTRSAVTDAPMDEIRAVRRAKGVENADVQGLEQIQQALGPASKPGGREMLPKVRLQKMDDLVRGERTALKNGSGNPYAGGRQPEDIAKSKALVDGGNEAIASADPRISGISKEMGRQITLEDFLERGAARGGKNDMVTALDAVAASSGHPGFLASKLAQRGTTGSMVARGVYGAGKMAGKAQLSPLAQQALLIAALEGRDD